MNDHSKHIDDLFREGLNDHQETPPASVWTSLEQRLPAANSTAAEQPSRRWLWILLLLLLLATVGYFIISRSLETSSSERKPLNDRIENNRLPAPNPSTSPAEQGDNLSSPSDSISTGLEEANSEAITSSETATISPERKKKKKAIKAWDKNASNTGDNEEKLDKPTDKIADAEKANPEKADTNEDNYSGANVNKPKPRSKTKAEKGPTASSTDVSIVNSPSPNNNTREIDITKPEGPTGNKVSQAKKVKNKATKDPKAAAKTLKNIKTNESDASTIDKDKTAQQVIAEQTNTNSTVAAKKKNNTKAINAKTVSKSVDKQPVKETGIQEKPAQTSAAPTVATTSSNNAKVTTAANNKESTAKQTQNTQVAKKENNTTGLTDINNHKQANVAANNKTKPVAIEPSSSAGKPVEVKAEKAEVKPIMLQPEVAKGKAETVIAETPKGKPITVEGESSKGKAFEVSSSGGKNKPIEVLPEPNKNKEILIAPENKQTAEPAPIAKNKIINEAPKKTTPKIEPAAKAKKTYERTEDGIVINMTGDEEEEVEKKETSSLSDEEQITPTPRAGGGGGGGGGADPTKKPKNFNKLKVEGGIKVGYDRGFNTVTTSNLIIAPFLQWNISPRVALAVQPGARYNQINKADFFGSPKAFHQVTKEFRDSAHRQIPPPNGVFDSMLIRKFIYGNSYDSIVLGYGLKEKNYWEIEFPLMLKYYISPNLSIFGGLSMTFGNIIQTEETRQQFGGLQRLDSIVYGAIMQDTTGNYPYPSSTPPNSMTFNYNTEDISTAKPQEGLNPTSNPARFGYLFGFSYELRRRLLIDFLIRQNISDMKYIPNENIRKIYTQPYLRLTVGYKLFGDKQNRDVNPNGL